MGKQREVGVIGLTLMGKNLALNIESRGYSVSVYNRTPEKLTTFLEHDANGKNFTGSSKITEFVTSLEKPRVIFLMVKAGEPTDATLELLLPHLDQGDILIDGGNAFYKDTIERNYTMQSSGIHYIGAGISGGGEGALKGPSITAGGSKEAYDYVEPIFKAIAAQVNESPCTSYVGSDGAGHYVKMVHNGIEYGDMQLISEVYFILKHVLDLTAEELHEVFTEWNTGELNSYLVEITADIFTKIDDETGNPLIDMILDTAGQKGTGKWASQSALDLGVSLPMITESVFARFISAMKEDRVKASQILTGPGPKAITGDKKEITEIIRQALYFSKICSYAQGFTQMRAASEEHDWNLPYGNIAMNFRGGCIIRAQFLQKIKEAYDRDEQINHLLLDPYFKAIADHYQSSLRQVISIAIERGIPVPALSSALAYYDSYRTATLPANLLQAQRDYFGAHTYQRIDKEGMHHTNWIDNS